MMDSTRRKLLALSILAGGLGLAWLVRPSGGGSPWTPWGDGRKLIIRKEIPPRGVEHRAESVLPLPSASSVSQTVVSGKTNSSALKNSRPSVSGRIRNDPPPVLASAFPSMESQRTPSEMGDAGAASSSTSASYRHRVIDGDTLESLAERYLGSKALAIEIYEANRAVIPNPRLLPIGVEIVIPSPRSVRLTPLAQIREGTLVPLP